MSLYMHVTTLVLSVLNINAWLFLVAAKKEEVEAIEKEAKDKHEKEWEGER